MQCQLRVSLLSDTPVVGCEINPSVYVSPVGSSEIPKHTLEFSWYRLQSDVRPICSMHHSEIATLQCLSCAVLKIPANESYHCSRKCFLDTWQRHCKRHIEAAACLRQTSSGEDQALGQVRSCGSWPSAGCWSAFGEDRLLDHAANVSDREINSWLKVGSSKTYVPTVDDFGCILKLEAVVRDCKGRNLLAPINTILTDYVIIARIPRPRHMIQIAPLEGSRNFTLEACLPVAETFSVLTYNVLSDLYATQSMYPYCPTWALVWEYRRQNLLQEIIGYEADILCLQEVQNDHFENFFEPELVQRGFSVFYKRKNRGLFTGRQHVIDGCATFYRRDRFKAIVKYELEFSKLARRSMIKALHLDPRDNRQHRLMKDNVAVIVILEPMESRAITDTLNYRFCVANTHIHANPDHTDVKIWQVATLINGLEKISESHIPILLCGDLNSLPGSAVHDLLVRGKVNPNDDASLIDHLGIFRHMKLFHNIPLVSAYSSFLVTAGNGSLSEMQRKMMDPVSYEPQFTNFTPRFSGTIDYILYSADRLMVNGLLELLDPLSAKKHTALPSPEWSSDHIALMAKFCLKPMARHRGARGPPIPAFPW